MSRLACGSLVVLVLAGACGGGGRPALDAGVDAGPDAGLTDAGRVDARPPAPRDDASWADAGLLPTGDDAAPADAAARVVPTVLATTPTDGATAADRTRWLTITFSQPMDPASLMGAVTLRQGATVIAGTTTYHDRVASFQPALPLQPSTVYQASVSTAATDLDGTPLAQAHDWTFTTAAPGWSAISIVSSPSTEGWWPAVAMNRRGEAMTVWQDWSNASFQPFAARYTPGEGWHPPATIDNGHPGEQLDVAVDEAGGAVAVWNATPVGAAAATTANRFDPARGWLLPTRLEPNTGDASTTAKIAIAPGGEALAVWEHQTPAIAGVWAAAMTAGSWLPAGFAGRDLAGVSVSPAVAMDAQGDAVMLWAEGNSDARQILARRRGRVAGWGPIERIDDGQSASFLPDVAAFPDGGAVALWIQQHGTATDQYEVFGNHFTPATGWSGPVRLSREGAWSTAAHIAVGGQAAFAVWSDWDGVRGSIVASQWTAAGWGAATAIDLPGAPATDADYPEIAADDAGNAIAVWQESAGGTLSVWMNRFTPGAGWGIARPLESDPGEAAQPQVAMSPAGDALVVWHQADGTRLHVRAIAYH